MMILPALPRDGRVGLRICSDACHRPDFGRSDLPWRKLLEMPLPALAMNASNDDARPILFGLLADGSGEARFAGLTDAPWGNDRASSARPRFSPSSDWYGRWRIQTLHGTLEPGAAAMDRGVCPEDIVIL
nr:hypothetical protein [Methylobacterium sp. NI91]